jgi:hypothetical protein
MNMASNDAKKIENVRNSVYVHIHWCRFETVSTG